MQLGNLADVRSGDKDDVAQISVITRKLEDYPAIAQSLTADRIRNHLKLGSGAVERYDLPELGALNFVFRGALRGGVTRSVALDAHGKTLAAQLLDLEVEHAQ